MEQVLNCQQHFNLMKFIKNFILILLFIFPISNSFGAMVTSVQNETFDDLGREINGIHFNKDGTKVFASDSFQPSLSPNDHHFINEYNLSTPYDISTRTYAGHNERCETGSGSDGTETQFIHDLEFSSDGMKLFTTTRGNDGDIVYRFDLTSAYDIST
jgi:WD40 repeat protein